MEDENDVFLELCQISGSIEEDCYVITACSSIFNCVIAHSSLQEHAMHTKKSVLY